MPEDHEVQLISRNLSLFAPIGSFQPFSIKNLRYDPRGGRFAALIAVSTGERSETRVQVSGKTYVLTDVPVLSTGKQRGDIITRQDVTMVRMRKDSLDRNAILDANQIVGMAARRLLKSDTPLRSRELQRPIVVTKGSLVTLIIRTRNMLMTVKGRAMQNGAAGDTVRVMSTRSKTGVEGVANSSDRVIVTVANTIK